MMNGYESQELRRTPKTMQTTLEQFEHTDTGLLVRAPGKVNLSLLITGKRPDGYHGIETLMAKINWYDELLFEDNGGRGLELVCKGPHWAPEGPDNLVLRACNALIAETGTTISAKITLFKNMPAGTGLGSASSDCAAALLGLKKYANIDISDAALHKIAASLGSDINFFLGGPLAYCTGRGENIQQIDTPFDFSALLLIPTISVSTKNVYAIYRHDISEYNKLSEKINPLLAKKTIDSIAKICANMLETSCFELEPQLARLKMACQRLCGMDLCLSGSGSAMYILTPGPSDQLGPLQDRLKNEFHCESRFVYNNRW